MRERVRRAPVTPPVAPWFLTYADMMSLLLAFFILLVSFSSVNRPDFDEVVNSLQRSFNGYRPFSGFIGDIAPRTDRLAQIERLARQTQRQMQVLGVEEMVRIRYEKSDGLKIVLPGGILFDAGSAELRADSFQLMNDLGALLAAQPGLTVEVRGHTDNQPLTGVSGFRDNFDMSYFRADAVARRLSSVAAIPQAQFRIAAYGAGQPIATNATPAGRAANQRIELVVRGVLEGEDGEALLGISEAAAPAPPALP